MSTAPPTEAPGAGATPPGDAVLSISDLQDLTGVPAATLRSWEQRLGFPTPHRSLGGQRRYRSEDAELVRRVVAERDGGLSLPAAVAAVRRQQEVGTESVYAQLRRAHPQLDVIAVGDRVMRALTYAIEDECLAHASRPLLLGSFQRRSQFATAGGRWRELSRGARRAVVFSDFETTDGDGVPERVALPADSPMLNEWGLICHDPQLSVALVAWEPPPRTGRAARRLEGLLSLDPVVVADAAARYLAIARRAGLSDAGALTGDLTGTAEDPRRSASLLRRFAVYADD